MSILTLALSLIACLMVWGVITAIVFSTTMLSSQISQQEETRK